MNGSIRRFQLEQFEFIRSGGPDALARLAGRWRGSAEAEVELLVTAGGRTARFEPLPGPPAAREESWRAAYAVPLALLEDPAASFSLSPARGAPVELPRPTDADAVDQEPPQPAPAPSEPDELRLDARRESDRTQQRKLAELEGERAARVPVAEEVRLRGELSHQRAELAEARRQLAHAEGRLGELERELAVRSDGERLAQTALLREQQQLATAERRREELEQALAAEQARRREAERRLEGIRPLALELERAELSGELLRSLRAEVVSGLEQLEALERSAAALAESSPGAGGASLEGAALRALRSQLVDGMTLADELEERAARLLATVR